MKKTFETTGQEIGLDSSGYSLGISPTASRVRGIKDGITLFDTSHSLIMNETHHEPVYYIPADDINMLLFNRSEFRTFCPFKGNATHWSLTTNEGITENAAWSYETPLAEAEGIKGYFAFYKNALDQLCIDEEASGIPDDIDASKEELSLAEWLTRGVWTAKNQVDLTRQLVDQFIAIGIPITRLNVAIRQLHPLLAGESYLWRKKDDRIEIQQMRHENLSSDTYLKSPLKLVTEGLGGIRQKLTAEQTEFEFPIMRSLRDEGATDYVALPLFFSDGNIHNLTLTTDHPEGFSTTHLGQVFEALPLISRVYELHKLKSNTATLLQTYLGKSAGEQVLSGLTKRGDGKTIEAAILFCDLTGSTALAEELGQQQYLDHLNSFFDAVAQSVYAHEGDILKFIGDAVLAIFPVEDTSSAAKKAACKNAIRAVRDTLKNIDSSQYSGKLSCTTGLHFGEVMYGNIGSEQRLDFTVIGSAANEVARISDLCKTEKAPVILSKEVAEYLTSGTKFIGHFSLRGFTKPRQLYTLDSNQI
ncbi:MAG: DUF427 domain-containing protein [Sneathiella sp.]|nr:DUF427 domain-containing protein [Sneathiella sp.]